KFLSHLRDDGRVSSTIWSYDEVGHNQDARREVLALNPDDPFSTPKPEALLSKILSLATNTGDIVLDSFAGSGTTGAVAHKMGRRWIMIELGEHAHTHITPRLRKVISGDDPGGITDAANWKGGGGFRYFHLAPSLLERDKYGNWVVSKQYNPAMLAEAMCKHEGFTYAPSDLVYWQHGQSTERDFIYVTTQTLGREQLAQLSEEVGPERSLLVCCAAYRANADEFPNLSIEKIPQAVLHRCEWGRDDYSLAVSQLPEAPARVSEESDVAAEPAQPAAKKRGRKARADEPELFEGAGS
ncbi:MAG TPA: site-specific DNA-methyltransferase, partial [Candidatus Elarobacter sp.]|nr:site-specific DNA-methyltransferase [Candidatus Elarobacter sp.]